MSGEEEKNFFKIPEEKKVTVTLCGQSFLISANFSLNDLELYLNKLVSGDGVKTALANVIYRKLLKCDAPMPSLDEVCAEADNAFEPYIMAVVSSDHKLQSYFDKTDTSLILTERFATASKQYWKECEKEIAEVFKSTFKVIEQINKSIDLSWINNIQQVLNQYQPMINGAVQVVAQFQQQLTAEVMASVQNAISQFSNTFSDIIANVQLPTYSEERKQQLEASYRAWGKLGWSVIPHAPMNLFNSAPADERQADKIALQYFTKNGMENLFSEMQEQSIKKEDLHSAIYCFENKQHKACALLLFGIIDAKLIRLQPKSQNKNRRKVGSKAVAQLETKLKETTDKEYFLYHILYILGLIECLRTFFSDGNDFRYEPTVINRNFVGHGMNRRSVRKKDCIQLFLALYNLIELLESL